MSTEFLSKVGHLNDRAEQPLLNGREIIALGVDRYTPAGVLYLLSSDPTTAGTIEALTGTPSEELANQTREYLIQNYRGSGRLQIASETETIISHSIVEAGGNINAAGPEHVLLSILSSPGARHTDAYEILSELGVTEDSVRQAMTIQETKQSGETVILDPEKYVGTKTMDKNMTNILSRLNRDENIKVLVTGERGGGKHTLLQSISLAMQNQTFRGLRQTRMEEITSEHIQSLTGKRPQFEQDTLYYADLDKLTTDEQTNLASAKLPVPLLAIASDIKGEDYQKRWEVVHLSPFTVDEVSQIVAKQLEVEAKARNIEVVDSETVNTLLVRYGAMFFQQDLPGAAVELMEFSLADLELHGESELTPKKIAEIISRHGSNVSADILLRDDKERILNVEKILEERIIGQPEAKKEISEALRIKSAGLAEEGKPIANLVFLGPTGVGKTEIAKVLAYALFDDEENMVRIDMSEYQEPHTVARLIGAPPGYVGYDAGGQLTEAVRQKPFSVVLLDEADKAHPSVLNVLLEVLDDGRLTDGRGRTVDFKHTVIIMTSNHGSSFISEAIKEGQDLTSVKVNTLDWFKSQLRPELVNRFDSIIVFDPIDKESAAQILALLFEKQVVSPLREKYGANIEIDTEAMNVLLEKGFDPQFGARPLKRAIKDLILDPLSTLILKEELAQGSSLAVAIKDGQLTVEKLAEQSR